MNEWGTCVKRGLVSGAVASIASALALVVLGRMSRASHRRMAAPVNAVSHWIHGDRALVRDGVSLRYTLPGYVIHHASSTFWAVLFERCVGRVLDRDGGRWLLPAAAAASAVACFTDYRLTPDRLRPGFEERLSRPALAVVYLCFGLGLAAGARMSRGQAARPSPGGGTA